MLQNIERSKHRIYLPEARHFAMLHYAVHIIKAFEPGPYEVCTGLFGSEDSQNRNEVVGRNSWHIWGDVNLF